MKRINNDVNGNPRYVVHFLDILSDEVLAENFSMYTKWELALHVAKKFGGIVFQSYDINGLLNKLKS